MQHEKLERSLSQEGKTEFGHIFTDGYLPVKKITPIYADTGVPSQ